MNEKGKRGNKEMGLLKENKRKRDTMSDWWRRMDERIEHAIPCVNLSFLVLRESMKENVAVSLSFIIACCC